MGWAGTANGALLRRIGEAGFDAFLTVDRGIEFQQEVASLPFGVIALRARSNDIVDLRPLVPAVLSALGNVAPGQLLQIR